MNFARQSNAAKSLQCPIVVGRFTLRPGSPRSARRTTVETRTMPGTPVVRPLRAGTKSRSTLGLVVKVVFALLAANLNTLAATRPNIVFILADDLGWKDVGYMGSTFYRTPNIDRLAREGMQFSQAYSPACVCSPSRGAIFSGKNPARTALTTVWDGPGGPDDRLFDRSKDRGGENQFL